MWRQGVAAPVRGLLVICCAVRTLGPGTGDTPFGSGIEGSEGLES
jgi:hypothetical protein